MLEDLADLFEQSAANGTPIREIVEKDPVAFVEAFMQNYPEGQVPSPAARAMVFVNRSCSRTAHRSMS